MDIRILKIGKSTLFWNGAERNFEDEDNEKKELNLKIRDLLYKYTHGTTHQDSIFAFFIIVVRTNI